MDLSHYDEERENLVDEEVMHLISNNGEFYPFTKEAIGEAISEFGDKQLESIAEYCEQISMPTKECPSEKMLTALGRAIWCDIYEYWENIAKVKAEKEIPSSYDLWQDDLADAADARMNAAKDARLGL